jgi:hypothetical protein
LGRFGADFGNKSGKTVWQPGVFWLPALANAHTIGALKPVAVGLPEPPGCC